MLTQKLKRAQVIVIAMMLAVSNVLLVFNISAHAIAGETGVWQTATNSLPDVRSNAASVQVSGYAYVIGGVDSSSSSTASVYYTHLNSDGSLDAWGTTSPLPVPLHYASAVTAHGYIYVLGGVSNGVPNLNLYTAQVNNDGSLGTWTSTPLEVARYLSSVAIVGDYMYVIGGFDTNTFDATPRTYYAHINPDGTLNSWNTSPNLLPSQSLYANVVAKGEHLYIIGGINDIFNQTFTSNVYHTRVNTDGSIEPWATSENSLPYILAGSTALEVNDYIYVMNGASDPPGETSRDTVLVSHINTDGSIEPWATSENIVPDNIATATSVKANGFLYIFGGGSPDNTPTQFLDSVYYAALMPQSVDVPINLSSTTPTNMKPVLTWDVVANANGYKVYRDGIQVGANTTNSFTDSSLGTDGSYSYTVSATGSNDLESEQSEPFTVVYDSTAPTVSQLTMSGGVHLPILGHVFLLNGTSNISADVSDNLSGVSTAEYYFDNDPGQGNGNTMSVTSGQATATVNFSGLSIGQHTLNVRAKDSAGNWSNLTIYSFRKVLSL